MSAVLTANLLTARLLTPDVVLRQETPGQLEISGDTVVYTLRRVVGGSERIELWTVPFGGGEPTSLTPGPGLSFCPRIDPAGTRVAYLHVDQDAHDGRAQVYIIPLLGGEAQCVSDFPRGATDLAWEPGGDSLIVLAEDETSDRVIRDAGLAPDASPTAIRLTSIDWRADGESDRGLRLYPRHLHRVRLDHSAVGSGPLRLTRGAWSAARPRVDRDGAIYLLADMSPDSDLTPCPQVHRVESDGTGLRAVTHFAGGVLRFHVDGDRDRLSVLAVSEEGRPDSVPPRWFVIDAIAAAARGGNGDNETAGYDSALGHAHVWTGLLGDETDLHEWHLELDDCASITTRSSHGSTRPISVDTGMPLTTRQGVCGAVAAHGDHRVAVLCLGAESEIRGTDKEVADQGRPREQGWAPDVYALDTSGPRRLTSHGAWLDAESAQHHAMRQPIPETLNVAGADGPITVFMLHPPEGTPCRGTVVDIHGGPTGQWAVVPPLEAILLAQNGFRVVMPNIRGSIDRGALWVDALGGAWGDVDVADVLVVVDALVDLELARPGQIGVMGLSYGGFLTQYLIGVTDRFAAAVAENGVTNQISAWAASDLGPSYNASARLADPLTPAGAKRLWRTSPLSHVAAIHTPLLMLQGGDDRTCPASDNEQLFVALRALGRTVEYVIYPEESHLMQATGRVDRRIDRHRRVLAWFDTHLGKQVAS
ncbi:MAG: prolyl oligopeptidase family serine peptidase [Nakamurella sp.]